MNPENPDGDQTLRDRYRDPIDAARQQAEFAGSSEATVPVDASAKAAIPTDSFPGYDILGEIHRGGQGIVYQAVQERTNRKVAIKVLLEGPFASAAANRRFEREMELVAQLKHPNIVTIFHSGTTAGGRLFFAMDYIPGQPLHQYIRDNRLTLEQTLKLYALVCEAVQAAHQKGVIHRDLKPSNILVDSDGIPRVLDFGLAKQLDAASGSLLSNSGDVMGTYPYMSPEQASGNLDEIDTRTDVYSLGVVLYQLLTGQFPYPVIGALDVVVRHIKETPATPPIRAWRADSGVRSRSDGGARAARCPIDDDVQTIVLKALAKERDRRYDGAGELVKDIRHYLAGEPIEAKRDSGWYVLRKHLRRYRVPVAFAATLLVVLIGGLITSLALWRRADEQRLLANASEQRAVGEAERADREATTAKRQAAKAEAANKFLNDMLAKANRGEQKGNPSVTVREVLDAAAAELAGGTTQYEPEVEASVRDTMGRTYQALGLYDKAEPLLRGALETRRRVLGHEHPDTLVAINNMGNLLQAQGKLAEAEPLHREALEKARHVLGDEHPDTLRSISNMGALLNEQGKLAEAEPYYREALEKGRRVLGDDHLDTLLLINNMGVLLQSQGKPTEAEPYFREALERSRRLLGDDHPDTLMSINNLGYLLQAQGKLAEAEPYWREALEKRRRVLGDDHPATLTSINNVGALLYEQGKLAEAEPYWREALEKTRSELGDEHPDTLRSINNMGALLQARGKPAEAEPYIREALEKFRRVLGDEHPNTLILMNNMGSLLQAQGKLAEAEPYFREALAGCQKNLGGTRWETASCEMGLGIVLRDLSRYAEAETHLLAGELVLRTAQGVPPGRYGACVMAIIELYDKWHAAEPGKGYDAKAAEWRGKLEESSHEATERRSDEGKTATRPAGEPAAASQPAP